MKLIVAVLLALSSSAAFAREKMTFACSGITSIPELHISRGRSSSSIEIDLSAKTVSGYPGSPYMITKVAPTDLEFVGRFTMNDSVARIAIGSFNRITGNVLMRVYKADHPDKIVMLVDEICKPTPRLF